MKQITKATVCWLSMMVSSAVMAAPAAAADLPIKAPRAVAASGPVSNWSGCYVGVNGGGAWVDRSNSLLITNDPVNIFFNPALIPSVAANGSGGLGSSGFTGGAQAGCNQQSGSFVWGVEADFDWLDQRRSLGGTFLYPPVGGIPSAYQINVTEKVNWLSTLRARFGGLATDRVLLYVTGGLALADYSFTQSFTDDFSGISGANSVSKVKVGWAAGAGAEVAISAGWSVRAEYLFAQFGRDTSTGLVGNVAAGFATYQNTLNNLNVQTARVAFNYKFY